MSVPPPAAGWYPDPTTPGAKRYWNGHEWTDKVLAAKPAKPPKPKPTGNATGIAVSIAVIDDLSGF